MRALSGQISTAERQSLLLAASFNPGPIDGLAGRKTRGVIHKAEGLLGLVGDALTQKLLEVA